MSFSLGNFFTVSITVLFLYSTTVLFVVNCAEFPKCEELQDKESKSFCSLCSTKRVQEACQSECAAKNCNSPNSGGGGGGGSSGEKPATPPPAKTEAPPASSKTNNEKKGSGSSSSSSSSGNNSGKNAGCNDIDPCVDVDIANSKFKKCGQDAGLPSSCISKCRYDIKRNDLQNAVLHGDCPIDQMRDYLRCASTGKDNSKCCRETKILAIKDGACQPLCYPDSDDWPTSKDEARPLLPCLSQFDKIMRCHWAAVRN